MPYCPNILTDKNQIAKPLNLYNHKHIIRILCHDTFEVYSVTGLDLKLLVVLVMSSFQPNKKSPYLLHIKLSDDYVIITTY